jgi:L-2-hydroxyglutarate oxidase LhgO
MLKRQFFPRKIQKQCRYAYGYHVRIQIYLITEGSLLMIDSLKADVLIVGAGIVGLACAYEFSQNGYSTILVEQHDGFGQETSSRNSEVIHSGVYYPTGSLKAQLCIRGNRTTYKDCERFKVWNRACGKMIVAVVPEEEGDLNALYERAKANGVSGLTMMTQQQARKFEPYIRCTAALYLMTTGIVDSHQLMNAYAHQAEGAGATIVYGTTFLGAERRGDAYRARLQERDGNEMEIETERIVNSGGLQAVRVAASCGMNTDACGYRYYYNRGHYYRVAMSKSALVSRLVYPIPPKDQSTLGIHITIDKGGQVKLGPDNEYIDPALPVDQWYRFDESKKNLFFEAVSRYFPPLTKDDLTPDQVGVRPKPQAPGAPAQDFIIADERKGGFPGLVNLIGIESPGLTCAREIAKVVVEKIL